MRYDVSPASFEGTCRACSCSSTSEGVPCRVPLRRDPIPLVEPIYAAIHGKNISADRRRAAPKPSPMTRRARRKHKLGDRGESFFPSCIDYLIGGVAWSGAKLVVRMKACCGCGQ